MKRIVAILLLVLMLATLLVACGKTTECELCGEVKSCKQIEVLGEKGWVCKDCEQSIKAIGKLFG